MSKLSHSNEATMHKIERDARAREGAESAAMEEAELREQYDRYCSDLRRNFPGIEGEYFGQPSFEEFKAAFEGDDNA